MGFNNLADARSRGMAIKADLEQELKRLEQQVPAVVAWSEYTKECYAGKIKSAIAKVDAELTAINNLLYGHRHECVSDRDKQVAGAGDNGTTSQSPLIELVVLLKATPTQLLDECAGIVSDLVNTADWADSNTQVIVPLNVVIKLELLGHDVYKLWYSAKLDGGITYTKRARQYAKTRRCNHEE